MANSGTNTEFYSLHPIESLYYIRETIKDPTARKKPDHAMSDRFMRYNEDWQNQHAETAQPFTRRIGCYRSMLGRTLTALTVLIVGGAAIYSCRSDEGQHLTLQTQSVLSTSGFKHIAHGAVRKLHVDAEHVMNRRTHFLAGLYAWAQGLGGHSWYKQPSKSSNPAITITLENALEKDRWVVKLWIDTEGSRRLAETYYFESEAERTEFTKTVYKAADEFHHQQEAEGKKGNFTISKPDEKNIVFKRI